MFKAAEKIEFVLSLGVATICGIAWGSAGFPHFAEIAGFASLGVACVGVFIAMIWKKE